MADTRGNISLPLNTMVDLYAQSGISIGDQIRVENTGTCDIYLFVSAIQPEVDDKNYNVLARDSETLINSFGDQGAWAFCPSSDGSINVSRAIGEGFYPSSSTGFNDIGGNVTPINTTEMHPVTQISAQYGLLTDVVATIENGGTASSDHSSFVCQSGPNLGGRATIQSRRTVIYRPNQGIKASFTAIYSTGAVGNIQAGGLFNYANGLFFGYQDDEFGITLTRNGQAELQRLTITVGGAGSASVTINDVAYNVTTTTNDINENAYEIADQLQSLVEGYFITSNGAIVTAVAEISVPQGSFNFTSGAITASWTQVLAGAFAEVTFYPQTEWNINPCDWLNPQTGNVYDIQFEYLGYGGAEFYIKEPFSRQRLLVHSIPYVNISTTPIVSNPDFSVGWFSWNLTGAVDKEIRGSSAGLFNEGQKVRDVERKALTAQAVNIGQNDTSLLIIRNATTFRDKTNLIEVYPKALGVAVQATKPMFFEIIKNPVFSDPVTYTFYDEQDSVLEYSTQNIEVTGGTIFEAFTVTVEQDIAFNTDLRDEEIFEPGEVYAITARVSSGSAGDVQVSFIWGEDY